METKAGHIFFHPTADVQTEQIGAGTFMLMEAARAAWYERRFIEP